MLNYQKPAMKPRISLGFTLVELLVVIAIISLLASIVLSSLNVTRAKSRDSRRLLDFHQFETALELFYGTYNLYPCGDGGSNWDSSRSFPFLNGNCPLSADSPSMCPTAVPNCSSAPTFGIYFLGSYPLKHPQDPINSGGCVGTGNPSCGVPGYYYAYKPTADRTKYALWTRLENDPDRTKSANDGGSCDNLYELGPAVSPTFELSGNPTLFGISCD